ncbi:MAG: transcription termination/antitermination protein NusG [Planctomycetota bacterium]
MSIEENNSGPEETPVVGDAPESEPATSSDESVTTEESVESAAAAESDGPGEDAVEVAAEEVDEFGFTADELVDDEDEEDDDDEDVSPIEEFVDESSVPAEDEEIDMRWYILKVQVNRETTICDQLKRRVKVAGLDRYFGDVLVPTEDVREFTKAGKQRIVKRKLYPGYVVVKMAINDESWFLVRETSGIGDFTGAAGKPAPLSQEEIDRILATTLPPDEEEGEEKIKTAIPFKIGQRVRVKEGYFENNEGEVSAIDERNGRITVMINIFGRNNPVELDHWHAEKI